VWQHWIHKYLCPCCARPATERTRAALQEQGQVDEAAVDPAPTDAVTTAPAGPDATPTAEAAATTGAGPRAAVGPVGPAIVSAPKPVLGLAKGLPGPGLLAHIIVSKYFDHLPLYRQERIFERQGVLLNRSTTCDWMAACAELLRPLYEHMVAAV